MSRSAIRVKDLDKVLMGLSMATAKIQGANMKGMIKAGLLIQRESQRKVPIDTGNLRSSAFTIWNNKTSSPASLTGGGKTSKLTLAKKTLGMSGMGGLSIGAGALGGTSSSDLRSGAAGSAQAAANKAAEQQELNRRRQPTVEVGYGAFYAVYVHEDMEASHGSGKIAKFLSFAISKNSRRIFNVIQMEARLGAK